MKQTSLVAISDLNLCKICPCFTHELIKIYTVTVSGLYQICGTEKIDAKLPKSCRVRVSKSTTPSDSQISRFGYPKLPNWKKSLFYLGYRSYPVSSCNTLSLRERGSIPLGEDTSPL